MRDMKTVYFGPFSIEVDKLPEPNLSHSNSAKRIGIKEHIQKNGLINPLDLLLDWYTGELRISKGNQRLWATKELGFKKVPCYVRFYVYPEFYDIVEHLKIFLPYIREEFRECVKTAIPYKEV